MVSCDGLAFSFSRRTLSLTKLISSFSLMVSIISSSENFEYILASKPSNAKIFFLLDSILSRIASICPPSKLPLRISVLSFDICLRSLALFEAFIDEPMNDTDLRRAVVLLIPPPTAAPTTPWSRISYMLNSPSSKNTLSRTTSFIPAKDSSPNSVNIPFGIPFNACLN